MGGVGGGSVAVGVAVTGGEMVQGGPYQCEVNQVSRRERRGAGSPPRTKEPCPCFISLVLLPSPLAVTANSLRSE